MGGISAQVSLLIILLHYIVTCINYDNVKTTRYLLCVKIMLSKRRLLLHCFICTGAKECVLSLVMIS